MSLSSLHVGRNKVIQSFRLILAAAFLVAGFSLIAQKRTPDYIATDSSITTGRVSSIGKGQMEFRQHRKSVPMVFGPDEIREYGSDTRVYESLLVGSDRVFYRRMAHGPVDFFGNKRSYILRIADSLIHLTKEDYRSVLSRHLVCEAGSNLTTLVGFNGASIANFVDKANHGKCTSGNLPYRKIGIYAGYNLTTVTVDFSQGATFKEGTNAMTLGVFFDYPIYRPRSLYLTGELLITSLKTSSFEEQSSQTEYLSVDMTGFIIPLGVKWVFPDGRIKPYLKAGAVVSYLKFNSAPEYFTTSTSGSVVEITQSDVEAIKSIQVGFNSAVGVELPLSKRKNIHIECKYFNSFDVSEKNFQVNCAGLFLLTGFNF